MFGLIWVIGPVGVFGPVRVIGDRATEPSRPRIGRTRPDVRGLLITCFGVAIGR
jgi:hypothetical protein